MLLMQHFVFDYHNPYEIGRQPHITKGRIFQDRMLLAVSCTIGQGSERRCPISRRCVLDASNRQIDGAIDVPDPGETLVKLTFADNRDESKRGRR
jgi:hypothetical protein